MVIVLVDVSAAIGSINNMDIPSSTVAASFLKEVDTNEFRYLCTTIVLYYSRASNGGVRVQCISDTSCGTRYRNLNE